jgi:hypothetical protein
MYNVFKLDQPPGGHFALAIFNNLHLHDSSSATGSPSMKTVDLFCSQFGDQQELITFTLKNEPDTVRWQI